jgi:broad specificity phosphatase PhoE
MRAMPDDALRRPYRIVLLRHGEAEGNVDETLFERKPDHRMELTAQGRAQSEEAGRRLRALLLGDVEARAERPLVRVYVSPYVRTRQTLAAMGIQDLVDKVREEPRLREQDWGNYQDPLHVLEQKKERNRFGHFFYRLAHGESGADVFDRVSTFLETLHRDFVTEGYPDNALLVTHGLTTRLFLMRWFHWSVEYFESLENPEHCEACVLTREAVGWRLEAPLRQWKEEARTRRT